MPATATDSVLVLVNDPVHRSPSRSGKSVENSATWFNVASADFLSVCELTSSKAVYDVRNVQKLNRKKCLKCGTCRVNNYVCRAWWPTCRFGYFDRSGLI